MEGSHTVEGKVPDDEAAQTVEVKLPAGEDDTCRTDGVKLPAGEDDRTHEENYQQVKMIEHMRQNYQKEAVRFENWKIQEAKSLSAMQAQMDWIGWRGALAKHRRSNSNVSKLAAGVLAATGITTAGRLLQRHRAGLPTLQ
ncbi:hypothetical protein EMCRGX_G013304 [Ephydatia muelleri]